MNTWASLASRVSTKHSFSPISSTLTMEDLLGEDKPFLRIWTSLALIILPSLWWLHQLSQMQVQKVFVYAFSAVYFNGAPGHNQAWSGCAEECGTRWGRNVNYPMITTMVVMWLGIFMTCLQLGREEQSSLLVESQISHGLLASVIAGRRHLQEMKHN